MIELKQVSKTYLMGEVEVVALRNVSLKIAKGEFISIMGPSGSGKSTMLHIIGALDSPSGGEYMLEDTNVVQLSDREQARIRNKHFGFIFQTFNLLPDFTALENVIVPMMFARKKRKERKELAEELLTMVGLDHRLNHYPSQLSGGERQRVAIARALANEPTVILADEPTGNLNTEQGGQIMDILNDLHEKKGVTIIMVTHSPRISQYAERVVKIKDGEITADDIDVNSFKIDSGAVF
ncbi:MAG: ABC transporter ATP-binding protein [bacterium]